MQIPRATYRFQFNEHFRLADALALVPYLSELGVSHVYASPLFTARPHSAHGYDVCDFSRLNPEIGTEADLEKLVAALRERKMGLVLDIVPNHMGIGTAENHWWWDVLKHGRASRFADYFDIDWETSDPELRGRVLVPILGDEYETVLERGELQVGARAARPRVDESETRGRAARAPAEIRLRYFDNEFPLAPESLPQNVSPEQLNANRVALNELIQKQHYRLVYWRQGDLRLNYRRFFAISTLAGLRVEDENVFNDVHALVRQWISKGLLDGLRVDHPDGLRDPKQYLDRLRALAPDAWIVVEKILQPKENAPDDWAVQGTVGYEFLNQVNGLFVQTQNEKAFTKFYSDFTGEPTDAGVIVQEKKRLVLKTLFVTEVNRLVGMLVQIAAQPPDSKEFTREQFRDALIEFAAAFPIYRTYVRPDENFISKADSLYVREAAAKAKGFRPDIAPELFDFLSDSEEGRNISEENQRRSAETPLRNEFVARFQQLTSPAMAKGVEDTAFYCLNRFVSLDEVGGDPGRFGIGIEEFHEFCRNQQAHWPHSMLCSSTHDTKRSEDVRARLNVLSEIPDQWFETVRRWSAMNERHRRNNFPDRNAEYLFYQTLAGAWPLSLERILAYMEKASCEAKQHTDWNHRNQEYDQALKNFVTSALADENFVRDLEQFIAPLVEAGQINSLAQTLLKLTAPGVPDIYQGSELWDFSLVDPDNRRPVDFALRQRLPAEAKKLSAEEVWNRRDEGLPKLWLIQKTLAFRAQRPELFSDRYELLSAHGAKANHVVAFIRGKGAMMVVPRFSLALKNNWADTTLELPGGNWRNEFTGEQFSGKILAETLFKKFPVALLRKEKD